ncbi:50S ribosomal protein L13 [bacterium]|nr:MAG: 50S ribosomal protein L13 [bacterium]
MKTPIPKKDEIVKNWWVMDAEGMVLGRLAARVARLLRGKEKPHYTPHLDTGDHVIVVNAGKIKVTGRKLEKNVHKRFSGYPGGLRERNWADILKNKPEKLVEHAVKGMLPKNRLGKRLFKKLHVYAGPDHPHRAQKPQTLEI